MGEGKSDRSGKRQRSSARGANKSSSDTELAHGKGKGRKIKSKEKWPLLEGLTVDELARYRRRRVQGQPKDNLRLQPEVEDKIPVTEYCETFGAISEDSLKENVWLERNKEVEDIQLKDSIEDAQPSDGEEFKEEETKSTDVQPKSNDPATSVALVEDDKTMETEITRSKVVTHVNPSKRPSLIRRRTTSKWDGDLYKNTETCSSYVAYEGQHRPELARRPTSLKMEGDLETTTEKCEKFIQWLNVSRPELMRVPTHLKLEGDFETSTENHEKYVPFVGVRRPGLLRQNTNLKLEGESTFLPEYTDVFKKHNNRVRSLPVKPETHLKTGTDFFQSTENTDNFGNSRFKEAQLNSEKEMRKEKNAKEEEMKMLVSKLEDLKGPPLEIPEYKDAYKNFPRERPKIVKPEDEIGRADGSKVPSSPTTKFATKIDQDPEYKSKYLDYQRDHAVYRKPSLTMKSTLIPSDHGASFCKQESKRYDYKLTSEMRSQYVPYGRVPNVEPLRMPSSLRLEGNLDLEPEYRTAYCTKRENQLYTEPKMHRRRDRSLSASRRKDNYWINNNIEQFDCVNTAQDQDAFQVLRTSSGIHEEIICDKPPSGSRRGSRTSITQVQRPMQVDAAEYNRLKEESTNPTYRLHVCNVDDEPQGFRRRRSPSLQSSGRICNPSPDHVLQNDVRPYSPSFGKGTNQHTNGQSFVVLDNEIFSTNKNERRRRRTDRNYNIDGTLAHTKGRTRTTTNWMPPWYDSTNTI